MAIMDVIKSDFFIQLSSNFLATIFAGLILYYCLENRVKAELRKREIRKVLSNFGSELIYNYVLADKILKNGGRIHY